MNHIDTDRMHHHIVDNKIKELEKITDRLGKIESTLKTIENILKDLPLKSTSCLQKSSTAVIEKK